MIDELPTTPLVIRLATAADVPAIELLDGFSTSPTRRIHREMEKYFGSVDPTTHEQTLIFLAEIDSVAAAKAELMLPPPVAVSTPTSFTVGYIKRVVVNPAYRQQGLARSLLQHIIHYAQTEQHLDALDLHVWEGNVPAVRLYESLGFALQHRELYFRLSF